jgi:predicted nuclease of restriction endonuclease-like (RecB) superfamily
MKEIKTNHYSEAIQVIKSAILKSRYRAAALANKELLSLYYGIGKYISGNSRKDFWGTRAIETISEKLQQELPGLRGFSAGNIKKMRIFYEEWQQEFFVSPNHQTKSDDLKQTNRSLAMNEFRQLSTVENQDAENENLINRSLIMNDFETHNFAINADFPLQHFLQLGFTHHCEIMYNVKSREKRLFYIQKCASEFWSVEKLKYYLKSNLYATQGKLLNNFQTTISDKDLQRKALLSFKDEYLVDYINIESPDDEPDERVLESEIVNNIRKFIMSLGKDFSFIGNQYRLVVEKEYFVDLLFFNRQLQCLVAFDLKRGGFKPEYLGKMNFYLSALDDLVRLPHENPSIGIILCKSQNQKTVEYAFRDMTKPMGVATYKVATELPPEYKNVLPDAEKLKELL